MFSLRRTKMKDGKTMKNSKQNQALIELLCEKEEAKLEDGELKPKFVLFADFGIFLVGNWWKNWCFAKILSFMLNIMFLMMLFVPFKGWLFWGHCNVSVHPFHLGATGPWRQVPTVRGSVSGGQELVGWDLFDGLIMVILIILRSRKSWMLIWEPKSLETPACGIKK